MFVPCTQPLSPFASERYMPPSLPRYTRFGTFGSHAIPCWSACGPPTLAHVAPPSLERRRLTSILKRWFLFTGSTNSRPNHHSKRELAPARPPADEGRAAGRQRAVAVVGDEEALVRAERLAGDQVDARVVARRDRDAHPAERVGDVEPGRGARRGVVRVVVGRQRARDVRVVDPLPRHGGGRVAIALSRHVEARADPAVRPQVRGAVVVPLRRVDAVRVHRVDRDVDDARVRRRVQVGGEDRAPSSRRRRSCGRGRGRRRWSRCSRRPRRARAAGSSGRRRSGRSCRRWRGRRSSTWRRRRSTCRRRRRRT